MIVNYTMIPHFAEVSSNFSPIIDCSVDAVKPDVDEGHPEGHQNTTSKLLRLPRLCHNQPDVNAERYRGVQP